MLFEPPKTNDTKQFYSEVLRNTRLKGHMWGSDRRFNCEKSLKSLSVERFFTKVVTPLVKPSDKVIDVGCGAGIFLPIVSKLCRELVAVDASPDFVEQALANITRFQLSNTRAYCEKAEDLSFDDSEFDVVILVDVLHHIHSLSGTISEIRRITRSGGRIIIYEPNILNPALFVLCLLDRNEWGVLGMGRKAFYAKLLTDGFEIETMQYSGLVIGPDSHLFLRIADVLNKDAVYKYFGWLNPKILITARKK